MYDEGFEWRNEFTPRAALELSLYSPGRRAKDVTVPAPRPGLLGRRDHAARAGDRGGGAGAEGRAHHLRGRRPLRHLSRRGPRARPRGPDRLPEQAPGGLTRLLHVVGTRPNFVKMAPVIAACRERFGEASNVVVHTGQHYDRAMSDVFFSELGVPEPDHMLGVGSGSHAEQAARVIERLEPVLRDERPDLVIVPGDVNSTLAAALVRGRPRDPRRPRRVGPSELRPRDARGDQPDRRRPPRGAPLPPLGRGDREPRGRGLAGRAGALRRQHDDRHPRRARGPRSAREAPPTALGLEQRRLPPGDAPPPGARRRRRSWPTR